MFPYCYIRIFNQISETEIDLIKNVVLRISIPIRVLQRNPTHVICIIIYGPLFSSFGIPMIVI